MHRLLPLLVVLAGCGARPHLDDKPQPPVREFEMEEVVIEVEESGEVAAYDAQSLFEDAQSAFQAQDFVTCDLTYGRLIDRFPQSRFIHSTLYNRGLCLEHLREYGRAATHFRRHAQISTDPKDRRDGEFRWGFNLVKTGDFPTAIDLYSRLLTEDGLQDADRAECHLRRGTARMRLGKHGQAERDLKASMSYSKAAYGGLTRGSDLFAEAHFRRGELYQRLAHGIRLKLPVQAMKGDLWDKTRFFRKSQASYIDAMNVQNSYWSTASGLKLGELYEEFYYDILNAQVPGSFDKTTIQFYVLELKKQLEPILEQSVAIYEKNITMSERIGAQNVWVAETAARLKRLRDLIEANRRDKDVSTTPLEHGDPEAPKPNESTSG